MSGQQRFARAICVALFCGGGLSGCVAALGAGALATTGASVAQERSTRQAMTDAEIRLTINNKLLSEDYGLFADISTEVVEGRVLLAGSVPRPEQKIRAAELVWSTPDVSELVNEISISEDEGVQSYAKDVWISTKLRTKLIGDKYIASINYNVETVNQVVHLIGVARSERELERVVNHARGIDGVREVVSHVLLKHDERRAAG